MEVLTNGMEHVGSWSQASKKFEKFDPLVKVNEKKERTEYRPTLEEACVVLYP